MATDLLREYLEARRRLEEATARVETMVRVIQRAGDHLRNWRHVVIGGVGGFSYPEMTNAPDLPIREQEWPTLQGLRNAMQEWHGVKLAAVNAYNRIAPGDRRGVQPPPE